MLRQNCLAWKEHVFGDDDVMENSIQCYDVLQMNRFLAI